MNAVALAHLYNSLAVLIQEASGPGEGYEQLVMVEIIIRAAGDLEFKEALTLLNQLRDDLADENPLDTGIVGRPIVN